MALKDKWINKRNGVDDVMADDINLIAAAVIVLEEEVGDFSLALDELHTYAESLVNGGATV